MTELSSQQIQAIIPHRYPFLLVDRILEVEPGKRAVGIKCVSIDEPFFMGHFPGHPVMPGVLIAEALAQVGAVAVMHGEDTPSRIPFLVGLDGFRFRRQVVPGDVLHLEVMMGQLGSRSGRGHGVASVDGKKVAEGDITFVVAPAG